MVMLKRWVRNCTLTPLLRWGGAGLTLALLILYFLNMPFYSGSALPFNCMWRMEHGRFKIARTQSGSTESFYIAVNNEGLKFFPECRVFSRSDWMFNIPLWVPVLGIGAWTSVGWVLHRRNTPRFKAGCPICGYDRSGNPGKTCPECGQDQTVK